ncbi:hypothetical protein MPSEU_001035500 [Mayamaea pseudoterrestris]|nr:hypothetical protein MPSEU_001035500 [Mayamaea pseudoterrestris]
MTAVVAAPSRFLQHCSCWLSPHTWSGIAKVRQVTWESCNQTSSSAIYQTKSWQLLRCGVMGAGIVKILFLDNEQSLVKLTRSFVTLAVFLLVSSRHVMQRLEQTARYIYKLCGAMRSVYRLRSSVDAQAMQLVASALRSGQAERNARYTIYWPNEETTRGECMVTDALHKNDDANDAAAATNDASENIRNYNKQKKRLVFILFIPGLGVSDVAYASASLLLLRQQRTMQRAVQQQTTSPLEIAGVAVVATDPLRVPSVSLGFNGKNLRKSVMNPVVKRYVRRMQARGKIHDSEIEWVLLGHSLGSFTAAHAAKELELSKVVMWGSAPFLQFMPDLTNAIADKETNENDEKDSSTRQSTTQRSRNDLLQILVVQASRDGVVEQVVKAGGPSVISDFWKRFPADRTKRVVIHGGTHAGFADYEPNTKKHADNEVGDLISPRQQQEQAVQATLDFLQT